MVEFRDQGYSCRLLFSLSVSRYDERAVAYVVSPDGSWWPTIGQPGRTVWIWHPLSRQCRLWDGGVGLVQPLPVLLRSRTLCWCWPPLRESIAAKMENDLMKWVWVLVCLLLLLLFHLGAFLHKPTQTGVRHGPQHKPHNHMRTKRRESARHTVRQIKAQRETTMSYVYHWTRSP